MRKTCMTRLFLVLLMLLGVSRAVFSQVSGGTINGTVYDPSGAVVPGAQVEIQNSATGITRTITSNGEGFYSAPNLNPGNYEVVVSASGFRPSKENVLLTVGAEAVLNVHLTLQSVTEVTTEALAPGVELASSTLTAAVGGQAVRDLPLNGRDWTLLATLQPNVHTVDTQVDIALGNNARANRGWGSQLMIGGNRPQQNVYRLDGVVMNDYSGGGPGGVLGLSLGVDSVQEFSVITGNATADYGRSSGGVINAITRSGTNGFHGSAYEFLRNSALDARNYFDGPRVPPFKRNQFGGSIGGPVIKNRTFFFGDYEGLRQSLSSTTPISVPSTMARRGQLQGGNVTVEPRVAPFLSLFPLPNAGENGDVGTFSFVGNTVVNEDLYTIRIDHKFSDRDSMHGTYQNDSSFSSGPDAFNFTRLDMRSSRQFVSIEEGHVSNRFGNFFRVGYSRSVSRAPDSAGAIDPRAADPAFGFVPGGNVGVITIPGITTFQGGVGGQSTFVYHYNSYQLYDDIFWTKGAHSFKAGAALERIQSNNFASPQNGNWMFGSLSNFLLNQPNSFVGNVANADAPIYLRQTVPAVYFADDWRILPQLTLNLGLRYEMATLPTERYDRLATLPYITAPAPKLGEPYFHNPTLKDFAPRVGFSWDPFGTGKTAVRGGFGIYDNLPLTYDFTLLSLNAAPFFLTGTVNNGLNGKFPNGAFTLLTPQVQKTAYVQQDPGRMYVMQSNFNIQRELGWNMTATAGYSGSHGVHQPSRANDENIVLPVSRLPNGTYLWPKPKGTHQNPNVGTIDTIIWNGSSRYDALLLGLTRQKKGLRIGASYTWSKSIDNSSSTVGGSNFNNSLVSPWIQFPQIFRGLSDFDQRYNFTAHTLWELPSPTGNSFYRMAARGWQVSTIFRIAAGIPFTPTIGGDPLGLTNNNVFGLPDRLFTGHCASLVNPGNPQHYIKTECFSLPKQPPGITAAQCRTFGSGPGNPGIPDTCANLLGNSGRNVAIGPGLTTLDFSLLKNTALTERVSLQFRAEAFNALNHSNFRTPDRTISQIFNANGAALPNAGVLLSTSTTSRELQFALKVIF